MSAVMEETQQARTWVNRVRTVEEVAYTLPVDDERRARLLTVADEDVATAQPLRPRIAAELLGLSEKTVRTWVDEGVLAPAADPSSRLLLDPKQLYLVLRVVTELRAAGQNRDLLDEVYHRLVDETWLTRSDLTESLKQMARGEGTTLVAKPSAELLCALPGRSNDSRS